MQTKYYEYDMHNINNLSVESKKIQLPICFLLSFQNISNNETYDFKRSIFEN